jgi:uncharacterized protein YndB with AHSA1/START domain
MSPASSLVVVKILPARPERVFRAWTRPEIMAQWFFPAPTWTTRATADFRIGGAYRLEMLDPQGKVHLQFGEYREIDPPRRLVFTWTCPDLAVEDSLVLVELRSQGDQTELTLTHTLPPDPKIRHEHEEGWNGCLGHLDRFLALNPDGDRT